jgi:hypothetical protein
MENQQPIMRCGIVQSRLFTRNYIILIGLMSAVIYLVGLATGFKFEGMLVGAGIVFILMGTYFINRRDNLIMELYDNGFNIISAKSNITYSYSEVLGILKDTSPKQVDFRYRIITSHQDYLLDTNQKDLTDNIFNTIGFRIYDPEYAANTVCWKRLTTDQFTFKKNPVEVLTWADRMSFMQFQVAFFSACTLFVYFILRQVHS